MKQKNINEFESEENENYFSTSEDEINFDHNLIYISV